MRKVEPAERRYVCEVLERHRSRLLALPGVRSLDVAYKRVGGQATDELAIRVHVERKIPMLQLDRTHALPEELEGIPLDVVIAQPGAA
jgi:hypothetical protein